MESGSNHVHRKDLRGRLFQLVVALSIIIPGWGSPQIKFAAAQYRAASGIPIIGSAPITETTAQIMARQASPAAKFQRPYVSLPERPVLINKQHSSTSLTQGPVSGPTTPQSPNSAFTLGISFDGPSATTPCGTPPDTMGAVGPTQFIILLNCNIVSYDKSTGLADGVLNTTPDTFFTSVRSSYTTDPHIRYDRLTQRWYLVIIDITFPNNRVLIAVSDSATITSGTTWSFYYFQSAVGAHTDCLADYPTPGLDANALYIGANQFCGASLATATYAGSDGYVVQKSSLLGGGPIHVTGFESMSTPISGPLSPQGVDNPDPAAVEGFFIGVDNGSYNQLDLIRVNNPGGAAPTISTIVPITTANLGQALSQPHLGNLQGVNGYLDAADASLFAAYYRNGSLWTAMDVGVSVGSNSCNGAAGGIATRDAVFWWEIQGIPTGSTPAIRQSGSICDRTATNPAFYSYGTIAVNGQGHAAIGYTVAGAASYTEPGYSVRLSSDVLGTMPTSYISPLGSHPYNPAFDTGLTRGYRRWGDYSYTSVDPCDDMTIWTIQEYASQDNAYGERVTQLKAPPPASLVSANPSSVAPGQTNLNVVITGNPVSGSGFYDTPSSMAGEPCRKRLSATVSDGVTVNSINYTDSTHSTLNISTVGAPNGVKTVTVTNPDGQSVSAAILQVSGTLNPSATALSSAPDPSVVGQSVTYNATVSGSPGTPTGTVTFYNGGISIGSSSLSTRRASIITSMQAAGTYTITATYNGDSNFASSSTLPLTQVVNRASTSTTLALAPNSTIFGQTVVLTATVGILPPGGGAPGGSVTFFEGGLTLGVQPVSGGKAILQTHLMGVGIHQITAMYSGDANYAGSSAPNTEFIVEGKLNFLPALLK
jgi:hypothetical protein